jgi:hypothetical protein
LLVARYCYYFFKMLDIIWHAVMFFRDSSAFYRLSFKLSEWITEHTVISGLHSFVHSLWCFVYFKFFHPVWDALKLVPLLYDV